MPWNKWIFNMAILMDKAGEGNGGGGAGGEGDKGDKGDKSGTVTLTKEQFDEIMGRLPPKTDPNKDKNGEGDKGDKGDLNDKAERDRKAKEENQSNQKKLESAIVFNHGSKDWLKNNAALLPKQVEEIFAQADKENYDGAVEKSNALKVGILKSFFSIQENMDLLTATQKLALEDFNKLTNTVKQEQAQSVYDSIFEPALESLRRVKKAESLRKGEAQVDGNQDAYEKRMTEMSRQHYLGEKKNGT